MLFGETFGGLPCEAAGLGRQALGAQQFGGASGCGGGADQCGFKLSHNRPGLLAVGKAAKGGHQLILQGAIGAARPCRAQNLLERGLTLAQPRMRRGTQAELMHAGGFQRLPAVQIRQGIREGGAREEMLDMADQQAVMLRLGLGGGGGHQQVEGAAAVPLGLARLAAPGQQPRGADPDKGRGGAVLAIPRAETRGVEPTEHRIQCDVAQHVQIAEHTGDIVLGEANLDLLNRAMGGDQLGMPAIGVEEGIEQDGHIASAELFAEGFIAELDAFRVLLPALLPGHDLSVDGILRDGNNSPAGAQPCRRDQRPMPAHAGAEGDDLPVALGLGHLLDQGERRLEFICFPPVIGLADEVNRADAVARKETLGRARRSRRVCISPGESHDQNIQPVAEAIRDEEIISFKDHEKFASSHLFDGRILDVKASVFAKGDGAKYGSIMTKAPVLAVKQGTITPAHILVEVAGSALELRQLRLRVIGGGGHEELFIPPTSMARVNRKRFMVTFETPSLRPLRSALPVMLGDDGQISPITDIIPNYNLTNLLPIQKNDLSKLIFHKITRISDINTLCFVLQQIYESNENSVFERIESVKILGYRVLEQLNIEGIDVSLQRTERALEWIPDLPDEFGIAKTSRYQSRISILYLRYLLLLFKGDALAVRAELDALAKSTQSVAECPIAAYNLCLGLLAAGLICAEIGEGALAKAHWEEVIRIFRVAANNMPSRKPATFVELTVSFEAAKQAAWAIEELRSGRAHGSNSLTAERLAHSFSRLRAGAACNFMADQIRAVVSALSPAPAAAAAEN